MEDPGLLEGHSHPQLSHRADPSASSGGDVTHLLSQINQNFKQSKADQILRLLHDNRKHNLPNEPPQTADESELLKEYDLIEEENVICDSDTLTESSSDKETQITIKDEPSGEVGSRERDLAAERKRRSRTSMGFHNGASRENSDVNNENDNAWGMERFDTRERSARPKSGYIRRPFRRRNEQDVDDGTRVEDVSANPPPQQRPFTAKPRARYGSAAARREGRKIELFEAGEINALTGDHVDVRIDAEENSTTQFRDRFSMMRTAKRDSKKAKKFCDDNCANQAPVNNVSVTSSVHTADVREDHTEVQVLSNSRNIPVQHSTHASSFANNVVPRNSYVPKTHTMHTRADNSPVRQEHLPSRQENPPSRAEVYNTQPPPSRQNVYNTHAQPDASYTNYRQQQEPPTPPSRPDIVPPHRQEAVQNGYSHMDTDAQPVTVEPEPQPPPHKHAPVRHVEHVTTAHVAIRRNESAAGGHSRPKNPEPIQSRPLEARPGTRRRLTRRYIQPSQVPKSSGIRPTSESVLLARQRTEKNLIKKQLDTRPQSEKIIISGANKILSVGDNPAQGPQTSFLSSKGGVPQPSHVQGGGFRGYDPGSRLKSSSRSRADMPGDVTLPRGGQANVMLGARKPLALMKLPPLEAMAAKSKKERGLALAARETCV